MGQQCPTGAQPVGQLKRLSPSTWHLLGHIQNTASSCTAPQEKGRVRSVESYQGCLQVWALLACEGWQRNRACLLRLEEKRLEGPFQHLWGGFQESEGRFFAVVCGGRTRDSRWTEVRDVHVCKAFFNMGQSGNGTYCPERLFSLLPWKLSKFNWIKPWESRSDLMGDPALSWRWNQRPSEVVSLLSYPMALISFCPQNSLSGSFWASLFRTACGLTMLAYPPYLEEYSKHSSQS